MNKLVFSTDYLDGWSIEPKMEQLLHQQQIVPIKENVCKSNLKQMLKFFSMLVKVPEHKEQEVEQHLLKQQP